MDKIFGKEKKPNEMKEAIGFVLISVAPSHEYEVHDKLAKVEEIVELHSLFGEYDLIAKIETKDFETLGHIIVNKIRCVEGVIDTRTLTATSVLVKRK
ncbi:MAG: Lrp/AsnC ligand binding domain-containing protein [Euryarchaeota archaeon]|nr:Lrp/AsnC ligand binding domain-containing protein [Euryarchaeota archaeon]